MKNLSFDENYILGDFTLLYDEQKQYLKVIVNQTLIVIPETNNSITLISKKLDSKYEPIRKNTQVEQKSTN